MGASIGMADYPSEMVEQWRGTNERLLIRPIRRDDADALHALFHRLSSDEVRRRFFALVRDLTPAQLIAFTNLDYAHAMALIGVHEATGEIVGVARLVRARDPATAEFAVVVEHEFQGQGLAVHLMRRLLAWARAHGVREVIGSILAENAEMLELAQFLRFALSHSPDDPQVIDARLALAEADRDEG